MHIQRNIMIIGFLSVMLFILGCKGGQSVQPTPNPYIGGNQGIIALFQPVGTVMGPEQEGREVVYQNDMINLQVELQNKGEADVPANSVKLLLKGISGGTSGNFPGFQGTDSDNPVLNRATIERASQFLPEGGYEVVDFGTSGYEGGIANFYDANIWVEYSYPYKTIISVPQVCFKEDPRDTRICDLEGTKAAFASGGPVTVGPVVQKPFGRGKIQLEIPIRNVGGGRAKAPESAEFSNVYDEVKLDEVRSVQPFSCTSRGRRDVVRLTQYSGIIRCVLDTTLQKKEAFTSQVDVVLSYDYNDLILKKVRIIAEPDVIPVR